MGMLAGFLHPLLLVRMEFRKILIGMGFEEMPTNKWVRLMILLEFGVMHETCRWRTRSGILTRSSNRNSILRETRMILSSLNRL